MPNPRRTTDRCIYCRVADGDTRDHVPPELLFPSPKPNNLVTVPACRPCNKGFQKDDEVLAMFLTSLLGTNEAGMSVWKKKVSNGLWKRSPTFKRVIGSTFHYLPRVLPDGRRGWAPALMVETDRILRVLRRIVRGLSWHEHRYCDFPDASVRVLSDAELQVLPVSEARRLSERYGPGVTRVIMKDVFEYHYTTASDKYDDSAWWLIFYGATRFLVTVGDTHR